NRSTAGKMGATTYIVPALVVLMSWAFLGETPRPLAYLGGALCLVGVAISRGRARPSQAGPAGPEPAIHDAGAGEAPARRPGAAELAAGGQQPGSRCPDNRSLDSCHWMPARPRNSAQAGSTRCGSAGVWCSLRQPMRPISS